jgi:membrane-bound serine protease (ClpP class)
VLHLANKPVVNYEMTARQKFFSWILDPNILFILIAIGGLALWAEFNHPGAIFRASSAEFATCSRSSRSTPAGALRRVRTDRRRVLCSLEAKYVSYGLLGIGGVICMIFGAMMLVDGPIPEMRVNLLTAIAVSVRSARSPFSS